MDSAPHIAGTRQPCIGVFDSGVGGLSVLRALRQHLPQADLLYVADSGHAPYGERSGPFVLERSQRITAHLVAQGAVGVIVACNTATAVAVQALRAAWPQLPVVGVEPGVKPAVQASRNRRIGVMATSGTLASEKYRALLQAHRGDAIIVPRPCPGLARLIERGRLDDPELIDAVESHCAFLRDADVDTVVLGCTHYPFVRHHIERAMGEDVQIIDTAEAVARHATRLLAHRLPAAMPVSAPRLRTTGDVDALRAVAAAWLPFECSVDSLEDLR